MAGANGKYSRMWRRRIETMGRGKGGDEEGKKEREGKEKREGKQREIKITNVGISVYSRVQVNEYRKLENTSS